MKQYYKGGILAAVGYILSPLSFWNDPFVNLPLAYIFASFFGLFSRNLFAPCLIVGYWLTNVIGFVLLHYGALGLVSKAERRYSGKDLVKALIVSALYTLLVIAMIRVGWLRFPADYALNPRTRNHEEVPPIHHAKRAGLRFAKEWLDSPGRVGGWSRESAGVRCAQGRSFAV